MQLTGTNRSIGLIALIFSVHATLKTSAVRARACFVSLSFAGLVVLARSTNPIPSRTRPLNSSAPMVLWLKPWESRSLPGLPRTRKLPLYVSRTNKTPSPPGGGVFVCALRGREAALHLSVTFGVQHDRSRGRSQRVEAR